MVLSALQGRPEANGEDETEPRPEPDLHPHPLTYRIRVELPHKEGEYESTLKGPRELIPYY